MGLEATLLVCWVLSVIITLLTWIGVRQTECSLVIKDRLIARVAAPVPKQSPNSCLGQPSPHLARTGQYSQEMLMERESIFVGIDIAKAGMDISVCPV